MPWLNLGEWAAARNTGAGGRESRTPAGRVADLPQTSSQVTPCISPRFQPASQRKAQRVPGLWIWLLGVHPLATGGLGSSLLPKHHYARGGGSIVAPRNTKPGFISKVRYLQVQWKRACKSAMLSLSSFICKMGLIIASSQNCNDSQIFFLPNSHNNFYYNESLKTMERLHEINELNFFYQLRIYTHTHTQVLTHIQTLTHHLLSSSFCKGMGHLVPKSKNDIISK